MGSYFFPHLSAVMHANRPTDCRPCKERLFTCNSLCGDVFVVIVLLQSLHSYLLLLLLLLFHPNTHQASFELWLNSLTWPLPLLTNDWFSFVSYKFESLSLQNKCQIFRVSPSQVLELRFCIFSSLAWSLFERNAPSGSNIWWEIINMQASNCLCWRWICGPELRSSRSKAFVVAVCKSPANQLELSL